MSGTHFFEPTGQSAEDILLEAMQYDLDDLKYQKGREKADISSVGRSAIRLVVLHDCLKKLEVPLERRDSLADQVEGLVLEAYPLCASMLGAPPIALQAVVVEIDERRRQLEAAIS